MERADVLPIPEKEFNYEFVCLGLECGGLERNERGVKDETLMIPLGKLGPLQQRGDGAKRRWEARGKSKKKKKEQTRGNSGRLYVTVNKVDITGVI